MLRLVVVGDQRRRMDGIDGDPLPWRADADDAFARARRRPWARSAPACPIRCRAAATASASSPLPGTRNTRLAALAKPNQPAFAGRQRRPGFALLLEVGVDRAHHVGRIEFAAPDADEHVVDRSCAPGATARSSAWRRNTCAPARAKARSTIWRPRPPYCALAASRVARRIAARARPVTTRLSHAAGGVRLSERVISTSSPLRRVEISGAMRPLIFAPTAELPTSV